MCLAGVMLVASACGGGDSSGQPQTEEGALAAVKKSTEGALRGNTGAVLGFLSEDCRAAIDENDVKLAIALIPAFFNDLFDGFDLKDVDVTPTIVSFADDTAQVAVTYTGPDGVEISELGISSDTIDVKYEGGKWVDTGCEFEDTTAKDAEARDAALADLGYAATREDPVPRGVAAPIGNGIVLSVDAVNPDAAAALEESGSFLSEPEPGTKFVLVSVTVGYTGTNEPQQLGNFTGQIIGGENSIGIDSYGCGSISTSINNGSVKLFQGGVVSGDLCFVVPDAQIPGMLLSADGNFSSDSPTFFDPTAEASTPVPVTGTSGPAPDGDFTAARKSPTPFGEAVDLGEGWTITILAFEADATATVLAASEFNDPPPSGKVYTLIEYELAYAGEEEPQSAFSVDVDVVGDSNVSGDSNCNVSEIPNQLDRFADLFKGGTISGNQCFVVDENDLASLVAFANADYFSDSKFALALE
jgi:hypothetical protein